MTKDMALPAGRAVVNGWQPIDFITPAKWYRFFGRRIGSLTVGVGCAFSWQAFYVGFEVMTGDTQGFALGLGPVWIGFGRLKPTPTAPTPQPSA